MLQQLTRLLVDLGLPELEAAGAERLQRYLEELLRWNAKHNLTAITAPDEALEKHLADSLTLLPLLGEQASVLDVGSGAGLPGLVLKCVRSDISLLSVDAVGKKISFQRHIIRTLGLTGVRAEQLRIESLADNPVNHRAFDLVVFRALGRMGEFLPLLTPCLNSGGRVVAMKGPEGHDELMASQPVLESLGLTCLEVRDLVLPRSRAKRSLIVLGFQKKH